MQEAALRRTAHTGDVVRISRVSIGWKVWVGYMAPDGSLGRTVHRANSAPCRSSVGIAWVCGHSSGAAGKGTGDMDLGYGFHIHTVVEVGPADSRKMDQVGRMVVEGLPCYIVRVRN